MSLVSTVLGTFTLELQNMVVPVTVTVLTDSGIFKINTR
jgi:hypothetical protein